MDKKFPVFHSGNRNFVFDNLTDFPMVGGALTDSRLYIDPLFPESVMISLKPVGDFQSLTLDEQQEVGAPNGMLQVTAAVILNRSLVLNEPFTFTVVATDLAGNTGEQTYIYKVIPG